MKKNVTILALIVLLLAHLQSLADCSNCTQSIAGTGSDLNINSGQTICIVSGKQTGNINFNGSGTLCIGAGAVLEANNINNFNTGSTINIYGNTNFANSINFGGGTINNYNKLSFGNNPNFNGASTINNFASGVITFGQATTLGNGGKIFNYGFIYAKADFTTNQSTAFFNINRIHIDGNFNPSGAVNNAGIILANGFINFNAGESFINNCRLVAVKGFNNNNSKFENYGIIWVPGNENSSNLIQLNNNLLNRGYLRTPRIINNATLTNEGGSIRIEGNSNSSDAASRNNGSGRIVGGNVGDASNVSKNPSYSFDDNTGTISATYSLVPAYDTTSALYSSNCSPSYFGYSISGTLFNDPNGLTDNNIGAAADGASLPSVAMYANLINKSSGLIVSSLQIDAASGNFIFPNIAAGDYIISISTLTKAAGQAGPEIKMPAGWIGVGEFLGEGEGSDNLPDNKLSVTVSNTNISHAKFGIQELPVAEERNSFINNVTVDEKYTLNEPAVSILPLEGSDPHDGTLGEYASFVITSLPANARLFYDGQEIINPVTIDKNFDLTPTFAPLGFNPSIISNYNPSLLKIAFTDEFAGATKFTYSVQDAAGKYSAPADYNVSALVILPITISNLKGSYNSTNNETLLNWEILGVQSISACDIERSANGQQFTKIGNITISGNGNFQYIDKIGINTSNLFYYRLKIKSLNGDIVYSNIIQLSLNKEQDIFLYPNPTKNNLVISGLQTNNTVVLLNTQGKILQQKYTSNNAINIALGSYPTGLYYVKIYGQDNHIISIKKVVKQ